MRRLIILTVLIAFAWMLVSCYTPPQANWHQTREHMNGGKKF